MASTGLYYGTQGGGTAVEDEGGVMVWYEPPSWLDEAQPGDPVPTEWGITGPFYRESGDQYPIDDD